MDADESAMPIPSGDATIPMEVPPHVLAYDPSTEPGLFDWQGRPEGETPAGENAWFLLVGTEAKGPFTAPEVEAKLREGEIAWDIYAWQPGQEAWAPLHEVFELAPGEDKSQPRLASFYRRFAAGAIDLLVIVVFFLVAMVAVSPFRLWVLASSGDPVALFRLNIVLSTLTYIFYMVCIGPVGGGRTPGYGLLRLRLVDQATRQTPSALQGLLWCVGSLTLLFGWIFYWFDPRRRMLHNMISRTLVIVET